MNPIETKIANGSKLRRYAPQLGAALLLVTVIAVAAWSPRRVTGAGPTVSLRSVPVPVPEELDRFVTDKAAAIRLGKALFWDMQVGSDGITACASCHFHAGADNRVNNTMNPGLLAGDSTFTAPNRPNSALTRTDLPLTRHADPEDRLSRTGHTNDVVSSQGIVFKKFDAARPGNAEDGGHTLRDQVFSRNGRDTRRVEPRNTPTVINAVFNFANFWDGRANHFFNGVNPFGIQDQNARIWVNRGGALQPLKLNEETFDANGNLISRTNVLDNASLASQAVGPPLSNLEMSWDGRTFPEIGKKMLTLPPLGKQVVDRTDSVLGPLSRSPQPGISATYADMIRAAFQPEYWNSDAPVTVDGKQYSQMEANFSFFFGLAIQMYEATLVSDDSPFDRFVDGDPNALTPEQQRGLNIFFSGATACSNCHVGPEFTAVSVSNARNPQEPGLIELMAVGDGNLANYDIGFYNIGVTPTAEDIGRGGSDPFGFPLAFSRQNFLAQRPPFSFPSPGCVNNFLGDPPNICPQTPGANSRVAVDGAFKVPGLRNVELTGPYFHNGSALTLMQVVDFYIRGGNFREENLATLDPFINDINGLKGAGKEADQRALVAFLISLTDERVRQEIAPFDHPQLFVPTGHSVKVSKNPKRNRVVEDVMLEVPAVGAAGRPAKGLPPLRPFLDNGDPNFHFTSSFTN